MFTNILFQHKLKSTLNAVGRSIKAVEVDEKYYLTHAEQEKKGQNIKAWFKQATYLNIVAIVNFVIYLCLMIITLLIFKYRHKFAALMLANAKHLLVIIAMDIDGLPTTFSPATFLTFQSHLYYCYTTVIFLLTFLPYFSLQDLLLQVICYQAILALLHQM